MGSKGPSLPTAPRERAEFAVLTLVLIALTTGPVYFVSQHVFHVDGSWEARPIKLGFVLAGLAGGSVWASTALDGRLKRPDPALVLAGIFVLGAAGSTAWSILPRQTLWRGSVYVAMFLVAWAMASMALEHLWALLAVFSGTATGASLLVVLARPGIGIAQPSTNWRGIYTSPNSLGPVCAVFIITMVGTSLTSVDRRRHLGAAALALIAAVPLVMSSAETAVLALVLAAALSTGVWYGAHMWSIGRRSAARAVAVTAFIVSAIAAVPAVMVLTRTSGIQQRLEVWPVVWERIMIKPWSGYGFFTYWGTAASMQPRTIGRAGSAHNSILESGLDLGLIGMVLMGAMLILAIVTTVRRLLDHPTISNAVMFAMAVLVFTSHLTESFSSWFSYMWILVVVLGSLGPPADPTSEGVSLP